MCGLEMWNLKGNLVGLHESCDQLTLDEIRVGPFVLSGLSLPTPLFREQVCNAFYPARQSWKLLGRMAGIMSGSILDFFRRLHVRLGN